MNAWIPFWNKEYAGEQFIEFFTMLSRVLCYGLVHEKEGMMHSIPLIEIMEVEK